MCGYENSRLNRSGERESLLLFRGLGLLGQKNGLDVWKHSALGDSYTGQQLVQLLVVADGELKVTWHDSRLLVVAGCIASQFQDFSRQVFENGGEVHWCSGANARCIVSFPQKSVNSTNWELKSGSARSGFGLSLGFSSFSASSHIEILAARFIVSV